MSLKGSGRCLAEPPAMHQLPSKHMQDGTDLMPVLHAPMKDVSACQIQAEVNEHVSSVGIRHWLGSSNVERPKHLVLSVFSFFVC